jgi:uncharacterized DUF497 family protein
MHNLSMEFTCNKAKNERNIAERGLSLLASRALFTDKIVVYEDIRKQYPEKRFVGLNFIEGRLMVVVFCTPNANQIHIISFRKANLREIKKFKN